MFVVYIIFRISTGYAKKVDKISQFSSHDLTADGYSRFHFFAISFTDKNTTFLIESSVGKIAFAFVNFLTIL